MILDGIVFLFGLIFGSFANVLIHRMPLNQSPMRGRSKCPQCEKTIPWWQNIPVLSFVFLGGKCGQCQKRISLRYPVVELLTAVLFVVVVRKAGTDWIVFVRDLPFVFSLIVITFIDLKHRIIPDELSLGGLVLGLATAHWAPGFDFWAALSGAALGFTIFFFFAWAYYKLTKKHGLGGGDIKLLAMLGAFLGPGSIFNIILYSSVLGTVIGIGWALITRKKNVMGSAIPYGPFLVIGGLCVYLLGDNLWHPFMIPI